MQVVSEIRIKDDWRGFAEWELSLPGGHTVDAWSMARFAKCRIEFVDGRGCCRGRIARRPDPADVAVCEAVLREMWREGRARPMYNAYHHHGHREYIALHPEWTPYPTGPRMTDCWEDIEAVSEHIEQMGECQRKGRMKTVKEKDPDTGWIETDDIDGSDDMEDE